MKPSAFLAVDGGQRGAPAWLKGRMATGAAVSSGSQTGETQG